MRVKHVDNFENFEFQQKNYNYLWAAGCVIGLVAATLLTYWSTLNFPFQFDDLMNITKNFAIRMSSKSLGFFDFISEFLRSARWIGEMSNKLNFKVGHFQPWSYRFINVLIHTSAGIALFALISKICQEQKNGSFLKNWGGTVSFLTAALFLLHPVQSQTVNYSIQARLEGLASLFCLTTLLILVHWMSSKTKTSGNLFFVFGCFFGLISCGTKEIVVVMPILAMAIDWFFIAKMNWLNFKGRLFGHFIFSVIVVGMITYYLGQGFVSDACLLKSVSKNNRGNIISHGTINQISAFEYFVSEFRVIIHYILVFFTPQNMSVEYDLKLVKDPFSLTEVIAPLIFLVFLLISGLYCLIKKIYTEFAFALLWFFICLAPRCTIIPCAELICDYKTYLASCGMFFFIAFLTAKGLNFLYQPLEKQLKNNAISSILSIIMFFAVALPLSQATQNRNVVWSCSELFWGDIVKKAPNKARANNNYAVALCEKGKYQESIPYLKKAIELDHIYCDPWSNLAVAHSMLGQPKEGIEALKNAINIFPDYPEAHNNIGVMYLGCQELEQAETYLKKAIELRPHYGKAYLNLGRVYAQKGEDEKSWQSFKKATETDLDTVEGFGALGFESLRLGKYKEAADALEKAVRLGANNPVVVMNLAGAYCNSGQDEKGENLYGQLIKLDPSNQTLKYNLALCRKQKGDTDGALKLLSDLQFDEACPDRAISLLAECIESKEGVEKAKNLLCEFENKEVCQKHKKAAKSELVRIKFQEKLAKNNGVLTGKDLQEAFGIQKAEEAQG